jgi:hypothetical protein
MATEKRIAISSALFAPSAFFAYFAVKKEGLYHKEHEVHKEVVIQYRKFIAYRHSCVGRNLDVKGCLCLTRFPSVRDVNGN